MTERPLMSRNIQQLAELFDRCKEDLVELGRLRAELVHRNVPKARALLMQVQSAQRRLLAGPKSERESDLFDPPEGTSAKQPGALPGVPLAPARTMVGSSLASPPSGNQPVPPRNPGEAAPEPRPVTASAVQPAALQNAPAATMSRAEALAILKVPPTARWEVIEMARREIVDRARPDRIGTTALSRRQAAQEGARMANEAFRALIASQT
jgi:hypothetical protein